MLFSTPNHRPSSSLLDRLFKDGDEARGAQWNEKAEKWGGEKSSRRQRTSQLAVLRGQIERDLLTLLSTRRMSADTDLSRWPQVARSVLNYGGPALAGSTTSSIDAEKLQRQISDIIKCFEPRLRPETLRVVCQVYERTSQSVVVSIESVFGIDDQLELFAMGISICLGSGQCTQVAPISDHQSQAA